MRSADWYAGAVFDALEGFECEMFVEDPEDPQQDAINAEAWDVVKPLVERIQAEALAEGRRQMAEEAAKLCESNALAYRSAFDNEQDDGDNEAAHDFGVREDTARDLSKAIRALAAKPGGEG